MKKMYLLLIAFAVLPSLAMAQSNIEKAFEQFRNSVEATSVEVENDVDDDGKKCIYEYYQYSMSTEAPEFKKLKNLFMRDLPNAYLASKHKGGTEKNVKKTAYGRNASKSATFGNDTATSYIYLLFRDRQDSLRRTMYVLGWRNGKSGSKDGIVYVAHVYSKDPQRLGGTGDTNTSVTVRPDGTIIKYDRTTGNTMVYSTEGSNSVLAEKPINSGADFVLALNRLRSEYISALAFAGEQQGVFMNNIMKPVNEIIQLCYVHRNVLSQSERTSCMNIIEGMKDRVSDAGVKESLEIARKYLLQR